MRGIALRWYWCVTCEYGNSGINNEQGRLCPYCKGKRSTERPAKETE